MLFVDHLPHKNYVSALSLLKGINANVTDYNAVNFATRRNSVLLNNHSTRLDPDADV